jgi:hypothetical protein
VTFASALHLQKALVSTRFTLPGIAILLRLVQPSKALDSILVAVEGIVTAVSLVHLLKALDPIEVIEPLKTAFVILDLNSAQGVSAESL